jgi:hypothetical protein
MVVSGRQQTRRNFVIATDYAHSMTTATRSVAVVATRLPSIDRRSLSQAWFSALHVAVQPAGRPRSSPAPGMPPQGSRAAAPRANGTGGPAGSAAGISRPAVHHTAPPSPFATAERRGQPAELTRHIERALVRHAEVRPTRCASIAIKAGDGRIRLLVRTDGATTRVVALCAPNLREHVDRALAAARFALAAAGTHVEVAS